METERGFFRKPLFLFVAVVVVAAVGSGGDSPLPTFLIRASLFLLAAAFIARTRQGLLSLNLVDLLLLAFLAVAGVSLAWAGYKWVAYQWFLNYVATFVAYAFMKHEVRNGTERDANALWTVVAALAVLQVAMQLVQRFAMSEARPPGTLVNPNFTGEYLLYGILACLSLPVPGALGPRGERLARWGTILFLALGVWLSLSRGILLVGMFLLALLAWRAFGWRKAAAAVAAVLVVLLLFGGGIFERFQRSKDPYAFERIAMWKAAVETTLDQPYGVGPGNYKYFFQKYREPVEGTRVRYSKMASSPHNEFLSVLSELGVAGGAIFAALAWVVVASLRRGLRDGASPLGASACLVLAVSGLHAMVDFNYHVFALLLVNAAAMGTVSARYWPEVLRREVRLSLPTRGILLAAVAAAAIYSGMSYAGWLFFDRGDRLRAAGRPAEAREMFLAAGTADPLRAAYPDAVAGMDYLAYLRTGEPSHLFKAQEFTDTARMLNPVDYRYPMRLGIINAAAAEHLPPKGRGMMIGGAYYYLDMAWSLNPRNVNILFIQGLLDLSTGNRGQARRRVDDILAIEPNFARGYFLKGLLLETEDRDAAIRAFEKAIEVQRATRAETSLDPFERSYLGLDLGETRRRIDALRRPAPKG